MLHARGVRGQAQREVRSAASAPCAISISLFSSRTTHADFSRPFFTCSRSHLDREIHSNAAAMCAALPPHTPTTSTLRRCPLPLISFFRRRELRETLETENRSLKVRPPPPNHPNPQPPTLHGRSFPICSVAWSLCRRRPTALDARESDDRKR